MKVLNAKTLINAPSTGFQRALLLDGAYLPMLHGFLACCFPAGLLKANKN